MTNRVYARIRNIGNAIASNVAVTFEVTDPLGMGITGPAGWVQIGRADASTFSQLAAVPAGGTVDVYVDWKPTVNLTPAQVAAGIFYFHSCLRVRIDPVPGETVLANQDGDREQENISYFQVPPTAPRSGNKKMVSIRNDDLERKKSFILGYRLTVPPKGANDWRVRLNDGVTEVTLAPGERREFSVEIVPGRSASQAGQRYSVDVFGLSRHELVNSHNKNDVHNEFRYTGGARIEALIVLPTRLSCDASANSRGSISVVGRVRFGVGAKELDRKFSIMAVGWNSKRGFIESSRVLLAPDRNGQFEAPSGKAEMM